MKKYMLTINREPAFFCDYQICFAGRRITTDQMEKTLYSVRKKMKEVNFIEWKRAMISQNMVI